MEALMANHWTRAQRDLFDEMPLPLKLGAADRAKVLKHLQLLLMEVMATTEGRRGADDDQDHA
jgi:hypothetical protein